MLQRQAPRRDFQETELANDQPPVMSILFPVEGVAPIDPEIVVKRERRATALERLREITETQEAMKRAAEVRAAAMKAHDAGVQLGRQLQREDNQRQGWYWFAFGAIAGTILLRLAYEIARAAVRQL